MTTSVDPRAGGSSDAAIAARRAAMAVLVEARTESLAGLLSKLRGVPAHDDVRKPETGLVMVRGRIGGDGRPFNVGEATVSRATVRLESGEIGFGYVLGRDVEKARLVALCDALIQHPGHHPDLETVVLAPLRSRRDGERAQAAARTAATKVDFFTLVRGED